MSIIDYKKLETKLIEHFQFIDKEKAESICNYIEGNFQDFLYKSPIRKMNLYICNEHKSDISTNFEGVYSTSVDISPKGITLNFAIADVGIYNSKSSRIGLKEELDMRDYYLLQNNANNLIKNVLEEKTEIKIKSISIVNDENKAIGNVCTKLIQDNDREILNILKNYDVHIVQLEFMGYVFEVCFVENTRNTFVVETEDNLILVKFLNEFFQNAFDLI